MQIPIVELWADKDFSLPTLPPIITTSNFLLCKRQIILMSKTINLLEKQQIEVVITKQPYTISHVTNYFDFT